MLMCSPFLMLMAALITTVQYSTVRYSTVPDHHPVVPVEVLAGVVDAGVLQDGDVGVEGLGGGWSDWNLERGGYHVLFNCLQVETTS